jgi:hypothetical protein
MKPPLRNPVMMTPPATSIRIPVMLPPVMELVLSASARIISKAQPSNHGKRNITIVLSKSDVEVAIISLRYGKENAMTL